jgi:aminopeptidase N
VPSPGARSSSPAGRPRLDARPRRLRRHELRIAPDFAGRRFSGRAVIEVAVREPVAEIVLNAAELTIAEASISRDGGPALRGAVGLDATTERARIRFDETLAPGTWRLALAFAGPLEESLRGFYRVRARRVFHFRDPDRPVPPTGPARRR